LHHFAAHRPTDRCPGLPTGSAVHARRMTETIIAATCATHAGSTSCGAVGERDLVPIRSQKCDRLQWTPRR
jgi:hypothetical protein